MSNGGACKTALATSALLMNDKGVFRAAPDIPGLLNTSLIYYKV